MLSVSQTFPSKYMPSPSLPFLQLNHQLTHPPATVRGTCIFNCLVSTTGALFWIASAQFDYPARLPFIWVAILIDLFGGLSAMWTSKASVRDDSRFSRFARKWLDFYPAVNIEHRTGEWGMCLGIRGVLAD
jgi:hypothetical protein